jgi:hypothetical protein
VTGWEGGWPWPLVVVLAGVGILIALTLLVRAFRWMAADIRAREAPSSDLTPPEAEWLLGWVDVVEYAHVPLVRKLEAVADRGNGSVPDDGYWRAASRARAGR